MHHFFCNIELLFNKLLKHLNVDAIGLRRRQQAADPRVTILTYHGISASNFERHLQWLTTHYRIVSLGEAVQCISGNGRDEGRRVVLTFDDGYKSFHRDLWPLLRTGNTVCRKPLCWNRPPIVVGFDRGNADASKHAKC